MPVLSLVRVAESWTVGAMIAFVVLVVVLGMGIAAMIGRLAD